MATQITTAARRVPAGQVVPAAGPRRLVTVRVARTSAAAGVLTVVFAMLVALLVPIPASAVVPGSSGRIVFTSNRDGNNEIYAMKPDGTAQTRLTTDAGNDREPVFSPDATRIAFNSNRLGGQEIWVMNADGTSPTRLTNTTGNNSQPVLSPDGARIAFTSTP